MTRPYVRLRETTFDLYVERDLLPGYYRLISTSASWFVLAGYILYAIVFTTRDEDLNATRYLVTSVASTLLILGYVTVVVVAFLCKSLLFMIDGVILPVISSSLLGLFLTLANFLLHVQISSLQVYVSIPLVTACITTTVSAVALAIAHRELRKIRSRDERRRSHLQLGAYAGGDPYAILGVPGPDDDAQRRQLLRLLHDRQESLSSQHNATNTFKIDLPGELKNDNTVDIRHDPGTTSRREGGFFSSILPWRTGKNNSFKDARERRREEIERAGVSAFGESWKASDTTQRPNSQGPGWGWPPATRYA